MTMVTRLQFFAATMILGASGGLAQARDAQFDSGPGAVRLVELYTSEGCSSCPPAESWVSGLQTDSNLWRTLVPVSFHVTYWDNLGWVDRFARPEFTERQQQYAAAWGTGSIYTPGFVVNGREWRGWSRGQGVTDKEDPSPGNLTARLVGGQVEVIFVPTKKEDFRVYVAPLAMNVSSKVGAGENSGRNLRHDFVVLQLRSADLQSGKDNLTGRLTVNLQDAKAIAVWVSRAGSLVPVQATGGFL